MKPFLQALALLGILNAMGIFFFFSYQSGEKVDQQLAMEALLGGKKNVETIREAETILVSKLDSKLLRELTKEEIKDLEISTTYGFPIVQGPTEAGDELSTTLKDNFSDPKKYAHHGYISLCIFEPDYLITFRKGQEKIDLLLSIAQCPEFRVFRNGTRVNYETVELGSGDYKKTIHPGFGYFEVDPVSVHHALDYFFPAWGGKELDANRVARGVNSPSSHTTTHTDP